MTSSHPVLLTTMYYHSIFDLFKDVKETKKNMFSNFVKAAPNYSKMPVIFRF